MQSVRRWDTPFTLAFTAEMNTCGFPKGLTFMLSILSSTGKTIGV